MLVIALCNVLVNDCLCGETLMLTCFLCSPHPVKPLTTTANQAEKKEGRSVLEKLKSTIHPGRAAQQSVVEVEKSQVLTVWSHTQTLVLKRYGAILYEIIDMNISLVK